MLRLKIGNYLQGLIVFLTLIAFWIAVTINFTPLYYWFVIHDKLAQVAGMSVAKLMQNYHALLGYLNFPWQKQLVTDFIMSANGRQHFSDIKQLFLLDYIILLIGLFLSSWIIYRLARNKNLWCLLNPLRNLAILMVILLVLMLCNFESFFIHFHELLFTNDDWLFDPLTDPIINVLPSAFFMACFGLFFAGFLISLAALLWRFKKDLR